jgi:hypothetical protein
MISDFWSRRGPSPPMAVGDVGGPACGVHGAVDAGEDDVQRCRGSGDGRHRNARHDVLRGDPRPPAPRAWAARLPPGGRHMTVVPDDEDVEPTRSSDQGDRRPGRRPASRHRRPGGPGRRGTGTPGGELNDTRGVGRGDVDAVGGAAHGMHRDSRRQLEVPDPAPGPPDVGAARAVGGGVDVAVGAEDERVAQPGGPRHARDRSARGGTPTVQLLPGAPAATTRPERRPHDAGPVGDEDLHRLRAAGDRVHRRARADGERPDPGPGPPGRGARPPSAGVDVAIRPDGEDVERLGRPRHDRDGCAGRGVAAGEGQTRLARATGGPPRCAPRSEPRRTRPWRRRRVSAGCGRRPSRPPSQPS